MLTVKGVPTTSESLNATFARTTDSPPAATRRTGSTSATALAASVFGPTAAVVLPESKFRDEIVSMLVGLTCDVTLYNPASVEVAPISSLVLCDIAFYTAHQHELAERAVVVVDPDERTPGVFITPKAATPQVRGALEDEVGMRPVSGVDLSEREIEILVLVSQGMSNTDIAAKCFVGAATVKTHLARTFRKLGTRDRASAVYRAVKLGIIS